MSISTPIFDGAFSGFVASGEYYNFPTSADGFAGVANTNNCIYPLKFSSGGVNKITFEAKYVESECNVNFKFESNPYPDTEPSISTSNVHIISDAFDSYEVEVPAHDTHDYRSFLMYIVERDSPVNIRNIRVYSDYKSITGEEFDFKGLTWTPMLRTIEGSDSWYNNEDQMYREENVESNTESITISASYDEDCSRITSGRIVMKENIEQLKVETGKVIEVSFTGQLNVESNSENMVWPAFWMLGTQYWDTNEETDTWPRVGEIDVMEWAKHNSGSVNQYSSAIHWGNDVPNHQYLSKLHTSISGFNITNIHTYSAKIYCVSDTTSYIEILLDGNVVHTFNNVSNDIITTSDGSDKYYGLLINLAVGGDFTGNIDTSSFETESLSASLVVSNVSVSKSDIGTVPVFDFIRRSSHKGACSRVGLPGGYIGRIIKTRAC